MQGALEQEEIRPLAAEFRSGRAGGHASLRLRSTTLALCSLATLALLVAGALCKPWAPRPALGGEAGELVLAEDAAGNGKSDIYEWTVVWPTGVHVRSGRSIYTTALDVKALHETVYGREDAGWVELAGKHGGFILIQNGAHQLLQRGLPLVGQTEASTTTQAATAPPRGGNGSAAGPSTTALEARQPATRAPGNGSAAASAALPASKDCKGQPGHLEWEVVADQVYVRMDATPASLILSTRKPRDVLVGTKEGDWLRLWHNRGFVPFMEDGKLTLKDYEVAYCVLHGQRRCSDAGRSSIQDAAVCEAAATTLELPSRDVRLARHTPFPDSGCFVRGGVLSFSAAAKETASEGNATSELLCTSKVTSSDRMAAPVVDLPKKVTTVPTTATATTTAAPSATIGGPRPLLMCWCVAWSTKRAGQVDSEVALMKNAYARGVGVFACNGWKVFSDQVIPLGKHATPKTTAIPGPPSKMGAVPMQTQYKMLLNTGVFFRAWDKVLNDGLYQNYDWTIKLDPDAVFFPDRFRTHVRKQPHDKDEHVYFNNCQKWQSMQGPLEAFSHGAMATLHSRMQECKDGIDRKSIGEDIFMQKCAAKLSLVHIDDWSILRDQYCQFLDNPCGDGYTVAFHPYKSVDMWNACYDTANPMR